MIPMRRRRAMTMKLKVVVGWWGGGDGGHGGDGGDGGDDDGDGGGGDGGGAGGDIYIMMKCLSVCHEK